MANYSAFAITGSEGKANIICSCIERMDPSPIGVGVLEIEDNSGLWEVSGFFSKEPNYLEIRILEVAHDVRFVVSKIVNKDWISQVQRDLKPVRVGRFMLYGHHDRGKVPINVYGLRIEAALAFGTGHHATTVGCLRALAYIKRAGFNLNKIIDMGCGTGVLSMAAAKFSRANVIAADIDDVAVETAKYNFNVNGLTTRISLVRSDGFNNTEIIKKAPYDLIFANILAKPLCSLANKMVSYTRQNSFIILSGILNKQSNRVESYYTMNGFYRVLIQRIDQWTTIVMRRK